MDPRVKPEDDGMFLSHFRVRLPLVGRQATRSEPVGVTQAEKAPPPPALSMLRMTNRAPPHKGEAGLSHYPSPSTAPYHTCLARG